MAVAAVSWDLNPINGINVGNMVSDTIGDWRRNVMLLLEAMELCVLSNG